MRSMGRSLAIVVIVAAVTLVLAGCVGASSTASPSAPTGTAAPSAASAAPSGWPTSATPSAGAASYVVRPPGPGLPPKSTTDEAVHVLSARLHALGIGTFSIAAGDVITITMPPPTDEAAVRAVFTHTGEVAWVPLPAATYGSMGKPGSTAVPSPGDPIDPALRPLLASDQIVSASMESDASGNPMLEVQLAPEGTQLFAAYTEAHQGDFFALVLDGRVLVAPYVQSPITNGQLVIGLPVRGLPIPAPALVAILHSGPLPAAWRQGP